MTDIIHIGDIGTIVRGTIVEEDDANPGTFLPVDISSATTKELTFRKQGGVIVTEAAAFTTDGTDGKMEYKTTVSTFFNVGGQWRLQGHIILPTGDDFKSDIVTFHVEENLS